MRMILVGIMILCAACASAEELRMGQYGWVEGANEPKLVIFCPDGTVKVVKE